MDVREAWGRGAGGGVVAYICVYVSSFSCPGNDLSCGQM